MFSTNQSAMNLLNLYVSKPSTGQELWCDCSGRYIVLHLIGWWVNDEWKVTWHDPKREVVRCYYCITKDNTRNK
jgi:hypothetical protein